MAGSGCCIGAARHPQRGLLRHVGPIFRTTPTFLATLGAVARRFFRDKDNIVETIAQSGNPSALAVLTAFLEDRLFAGNQNQMVVIVKPGEEGRH